MQHSIRGPTTVRQFGLRIRKSVADEPERTVEFAIESDRDVPVAIRVRETLPEGIDASSIGFQAERESAYWHVSNRSKVEFRRIVAPGDTLVATYAVPDVAGDAPESVSAPEIVTVQQVDRAALEADGPPLWRGDGGTVPAGRVGRSVSVSGHERTAPTDTGDRNASSGKVVARSPPSTRSGQSPTSSNGHGCMPTAYS